MEGRILMTQIYGTLGPACASQEMLEAMLRNGLTGMRLNLSHCDLADSRELLEAFLAVAPSVAGATGGSYTADLGPRTPPPSAPAPAIAP